MFQQQYDRVPTDPSLQIRQRQQRFELGGEHQAATVHGVVQGFFPEPIADQIELARHLVVERDGEHADGQPDRLHHTQLLECAQQNLRVGMTAPGNVSRQLRLQFRGVIDLPVVDHGEPAGVRGHGLGPRLAQILDRQAPMPESQALVRTDQDPVRVGAAMGERIGHSPDLRLQLTCRIIGRENSR
jgi:hypothetical protein